MSAGPSTPLWAALEQAGGVPAQYHDRQLMRHFGDPAAEYLAATESAAVFDRSHRTRLAVRGRSPGQMLNGIVTGTLPAAPAQVTEGVLGGRATYHAVLTPKGKMITDVWMLRLGDEDTDGYLLDVPVAGREGLLEHLGKFLPPRLAKVEDVTETVACVTVSGPGAAPAVSRLALGLRLGVDDLTALAEGDWRVADASAASGLVVMRTSEIWPNAWSVYGPVRAVGALYGALRTAGVASGGLGVWSTLRVEAGRPTYGSDMDVDTIPIEAGIHERAIDHSKGCYTGQEVIVRIRDRGHVNRHLRRLDLGDVPAPAPGTELLALDSDKSVGRITSAVQSPKFGGALALAYVRRGVDAVRLGDRTVVVPTEE